MRDTVTSYSHAWSSYSYTIAITMGVLVFAFILWYTSLLTVMP